MRTNANHRSDPSHGVFATTHWSVVLSARNGDSSEAFTALESLCRSYWRPVYAYVRRDGQRPEDAQDLTQEFFRRFIQKDWIEHLRHQRGKFRSFLLTFLKHFLSDERERAGALKRGGGATLIALDNFEAEERYAQEPANSTPDQAFERRWAQTVMERAVQRLRDEYREDGKGPLFEMLKDLQPGERAGSGYAELGVQLGMSEGAVKSAAYRMRLRHRDLLHAEIASTVVDASEVEDEIRHLIAVLGG